MRYINVRKTRYVVYMYIYMQCVCGVYRYAPLQVSGVHVCTYAVYMCGIHICCSEVQCVVVCVAG